MRWLTAGESHGQALSAIIEGIPASVHLTSKDIDFHLARRRLGFGRGARQNFEADKITILGGIRLGLTQGGPISIQVGNSEWPKWEKVMSADPVADEEIKDLARNAPLTRPRPGHADMVGMQKYDFDDARPILDSLAKNYPATWVFSVAGLIGATPELLLRLSRGMVTSRVLAGTIPKTGDDSKDLALAGSLARSSKDLEEHEFAVRSVADALEPFCSSTNVPDAPFVLHLANVMHLATDVTGALIESKKDIDVFSLLKSLHPSAAVCGTPRNKAFDVIEEIEGMNRGRYAGPVGWVDARGDGELGIALRSGQIDKNQIRIFAGCGIVSGSDPDVEVAESLAKFAAMQSALN